MNPVLKFFSSLRLTLVLLALSMILVFFGTMAQEPLGLYIAQDRFFQSLFVDGLSMVAAVKKTLQMFLIHLPPTTAEEVLRGPRIPAFPGGYLLGSLLLVNLLAAHATRFKMTWKKSGIFLVHAGVVLLLLGQLFTDVWARESGMRFPEGETRNYSESDRRSELAIVDVTAPDRDRVVVIPEALLAQGGRLSEPSLPFTIEMKRFMVNSYLTNRVGRMTNEPVLATEGVGPRVAAFELPKVTQMDYRDVPSAVIELRTPEKSLGTWLVSGHLERPQRVSVGGRDFDLTLRLERFYKDFSLTLLDFRHDKYRGTEIPKNFSSQVRLRNAKTGEDREVLIYMNNPLRYDGQTFYQASFDPKDDRVTILQVVRNPTWLTPYFGCLVVGLGLVVQFGISLVVHVKRRAAAAPVNAQA
ncbi:MAG: cytochrome c biogenesis protein ResB [Limisphaerales bacterium]